MRLTHASSYAVHALAHLAAVGPDRWVHSYDIARGRGIPERFILKVLRPLVTSRLVRSRKGLHGGFRLAKPAASIALLEVVEAVEGPLRGETPVWGPDQGGLDARLREVCEEVVGLVRRRLGRVRLSDLAGRQYPGEGGRGRGAGRRAQRDRRRSLPVRGQGRRRPGATCSPGPRPGIGEPGRRYRAGATSTLPSRG
jgi:Rrf2 family protein